MTRFDAKDLALFVTIANQVSVWLENSRLERSLVQLGELQAQLEHQALHDPLTGLANRALFTSLVANAIDRGERKHRPLAVLFLDLDDFKAVNDRLGHAIGDSLLVAAAERLRRSLRPGDAAARFGGDEFAVLLQDIAGIGGAATAADRIGAELRQPFRIEGRDARVSASIGIATNTYGDHSDAAELLRNADLAMYIAKRRGKGRFEVFEPSMYDAAIERHEMTADLVRAVEANQLAVHFQPIIDLTDDSVAGVEALVRWDRPGHGMVEPSTFIPLAEECGLIVPIGTHVLREACRWGALWQRMASGGGRPPFTVNVNLSARQLGSPLFVDEVRLAMHDAGLMAGSLVLEITETVLMEGEGLGATLDELRLLGVQLAIDDFGTGYSSLSYLRRFPIDVLKMDKTFVQGVGITAGDEHLARAIIDLTHSLGLTVVAEGIERVEQRDVLADLHCNLGQGNLFAPAMTADGMTAVVERGRHHPTLSPN